MGKAKTATHHHDPVRRLLVPNPHRSDALVADELAVLEAAQVRDRAALPGFIEAEVNLATMIGGLSRVDGLTEAQKLAAAKLRGLYERSMIGGARALDYMAVRVDTSGVASSDDVDRGCDARAELAEAIQRMGAIHSAVVLPVVLQCQPLRALARRIGEGQGGAAIERVKKRVLTGVDVLAGHFGYAEARGRAGKLRAEGEAPTVFSGVITTRKRAVPA